MYFLGIDGHIICYCEGISFLYKIAPSSFKGHFYLEQSLFLCSRTCYDEQARAEVGLATVWDAALGRMLAPALAAYELQRCTGVVAGNEARMPLLGGGREGAYL